MKIAVVIERYTAQGGGAERSTAQIVGELLRRGHDVTVIAAAADEQPADTPLTLRVLGKARRMHALRLWRFERFVRGELERGGFDVSLSITTSAPATVVQPRAGLILEVQARNVAMRRGAAGRALKWMSTRLSLKQWMLRIIERHTVRDPMVQRFVAISGYIARQLESHYAVPADRITVIPNAAEMPDLSADQRARMRSVVRGAYSIDGAEQVLLFAAINPALKGWGTLLGALARLKEVGHAATVLAAGEIRHEHLVQAAERGVRDRIKVVGPTARMAELYAAADLTVLPTWFDPSSKVVIESLMVGTPAISTAYNGASGFILPSGRLDDAARGRVIDDPGDDAALAAAITELADPHVYARCSAACAGLSDELSMRRHVDALETVLADAAASSKAQSEAAAVEAAAPVES